MLGLTLLRPWEQAVFFLGKDDENRKWHPAETVRGQRIALHAGKGWDRDGAAFILGMVSSPTIWAQCHARSMESAGLIVGTAIVAGWRRVGQMEAEQPKGWAFGPWAWWLEDKRVLPDPVPCKGALSLWRVPPDVEARVLAQEARR